MSTWQTPDKSPASRFRCALLVGNTLHRCWGKSACPYAHPLEGNQLLRTGSSRLVPPGLCSVCLFPLLILMCPFTVVSCNHEYSSFSRSPESILRAIKLRNVLGTPDTLTNPSRESGSWGLSSRTWCHLSLGHCHVTTWFQPSSRSK